MRKPSTVVRLKVPAKSSTPFKGDIKLGFDTRTIELALTQIMPLKVTTPAIKASEKFQQIMASIREVGIIEPPVVAPNKDQVNSYLMLDGHLRLEALRGLGVERVTCLVSRDDEAFTYNKHINRLSIVQEHRMIVEAVKRGVPEAKIAQALNINVNRIIRKRKPIDGICSEAVELLKDKIVPENVFGILKKMKAVRQVEAATLMISAGTYSMSYARALLAATHHDQLLNPEKQKQATGLSEEQMARMESEMDSVQREFRLVEDSYGADVLNLTLARGYLANLLGNARVTRYLQQNHAEILSQFVKIADMTNLAGKEATRLV
jgi:hypothetical protein